MEKLLNEKIDKMDLVIAGTGHRPPRLGLDYDSESNQMLTMFAKTMLTRMLDKGFVIKEVISGMAQGWDTALAHASILLKLPLIAAVPFKGQEERWPKSSQTRFNAILSKAKHVEFVCEEYSKSAYVKRDHWMVDRATAAENSSCMGVLLAVFDKSEYGGTFETVGYAQSHKLYVANLWPAWSKFLDGVSNSLEPTRGDTNGQNRTSSVGSATR